MRPRHLVLATTVGLAALAAAAQQPADPSPRPGHALVMRLDANQDGRVSRAEFDRGHAERFAQLDADASGGVSFEEMAAGMPRHEPGMGPGMGPGDGERQGEARGERRRQHLQARFAAADADGDGSLSRAEFDALGDARFAHMDANGDGMIEPGEPGRGRARQSGPAPGEGNEP